MRFNREKVQTLRTTAGLWTVFIRGPLHNRCSHFKSSRSSATSSKSPRGIGPGTRRNQTSSGAWIPPRSRSSVDASGRSRSRVWSAHACPDPQHHQISAAWIASQRVPPLSLMRPTSGRHYRNGCSEDHQRAVSTGRICRFCLRQLRTLPAQQANEKWYVSHRKRRQKYERPFNE